MDRRECCRLTVTIRLDPARHPAHSKLAAANALAIHDHIAVTDRPSGRFGVIEIGSRAIRLLVAEISKDQRIAEKFGDAKDVYLLESAEKGEAANKAEIERVWKLVKQFRDKARELNSKRIDIFATEAIRQLSYTAQAEISALS
jgi:hypothetical protein